MASRDDAEERLSRLMAQAQAGDDEAYLALLHAVAPWVRQVIRARRHFLPPSDVEDLVQDVLLSLHAARATYDPARPFKPWLGAITGHRLADAARRYGRHAGHELGVDDLDVTFAALPANTHEEAPDREVLTDAIRSLPAGQRQAVELLKLQELSLKEASDATGLSVSALKVATHRALRSLRERFGVAGRQHED
jgi:RNA polymerase sigma-70 factor (ECF subfamily)